MRHAAHASAAMGLLLLGALACSADRTPSAPLLEPDMPALTGDHTCPTGSTALAAVRQGIGFSELPGDHHDEPPLCHFVDGRMTGGGGQIIIGDVFVSRGFTIHCDLVLSNNVEVNWPDNQWHLDKPLTAALCIDDPAYNPVPPEAPFDTFIGEGVGRLNGVDGSQIRFKFIDNGEPGSTDLAEIRIYAVGDDPATATPVLTVPLSTLDRGNIQAHYDQPHGSKGN